MFHLNLAKHRVHHLSPDFAPILGSIIWILCILLFALVFYSKVNMG